MATPRRLLYASGVPELRTTPIRELERLETGAVTAMLESGQPWVLRELARAWAAVRAWRAGAQELASYLGRFDSGVAVDAIMTPPEERGRVFYNADMSGF